MNPLTFNNLSGWPCIGALVCLLFTLKAEANVPSAYYACEGANNGDHCQLPGPRYGNCVLDTLCTDPPETTVNECLLCVDGCWGMQSGTACVMRDGRDGVCESQPDCTTDPDKSFDQCNWCVDGDIPRREPREGGCATLGRFHIWPWMLLGILSLLQYRRERH